ncbi:MAG: hypothetical protein F6K10_01260 [Moorea sp. SIO2B7]|nr:hypothetical protein [Moorena sp. SIO2B7]
MSKSEAISVGREAESIENLVEKQVLLNWQAHDEPGHLKTIRDRLLINKQCAGGLLGLYQKILQQGKIVADDNPEKIKLRLSGLIIREKVHLRVANHLHETVFNQNWAEKELRNLRPYAETFTAWVD